MTWQPIESAPKDREDIILAAHFIGAKWLVSSGWHWTWHTHPTHWAPAPGVDGGTRGDGENLHARKPENDPCEVLTQELITLVASWRASAREWEADGGQSWKVETLFECADEVDAILDRLSLSR